MAEMLVSDCKGFEILKRRVQLPKGTMQYLSLLGATSTALTDLFEVLRRSWPLYKCYNVVISKPHKRGSDVFVDIEMIIVPDKERQP